MRRALAWLFTIIIITMTIFLALFIYLINDADHIENIDMPKIETKQEMKQVAVEFDDSVFSLMNKTSEEIVELIGDPERKDKSAYGYTWWVYDSLEKYIQLGIKDDRVETVFATGDELDSAPISIGESYEDLSDEFNITANVTYEKGISHYTFVLNEEDLQANPLIKLDEDLFVQANIDIFTNEVSSLRIMTGDLLLTQRFYEMEYRGSLPEEIELSDEEWEEVQQGMEEHIVSVTNVYRNRFDLPLLEYDSLVSKVAYAHSKDMHDQQYFSHESKDGRGLKERIEAEDVYYVGAGENIAAQHSDALAAMHGWLNSEGHRETMLNEQYNYLGVGVHRLYYTQNFIFKH
ncbi:MAG TPA: CAP domain-containing protein [Pseudogracilibacillus sp.]|nr:CAP domain-containing protein [Pseudogracilibacillus sp.]